MQQDNSTHNSWSVEIRIGKCNINLKTEGAYAVSLKINKFLSTISAFKHVDANSSIQFNTTLRMNVDKQSIEQNQNCSIILHFQKDETSRKQKKIIGMASLSVLKQNNTGFKFYGFGQCADSQAEIQASVNYYEFPLQISKNSNYVKPSYSSNSELYDLQRSRGVESSIQQFKDHQTDFTKEQKAYSHIGSSQRYKKGKYQSQILSKYHSRIKQAKQQGQPDQIITVLQSQIDQLNGSIQQLKEREQKTNYWKKDMKQIILQLQAENQLLKQIKIEELHEYNIQNIEDGILLISKFVRQKFQASKLQHKSSSFILASTNDKSLMQTKSWTKLPKFSDIPQDKQNPKQSQEEKKYQNKVQNWKNQLKIPQAKKQQLQQEIIQIRKQRNQLYQISEQLYTELKQCKEERDKYLNQIRQFQLASAENSSTSELKETIQTLKQQIQMLNFSLQHYSSLDSSNEIKRLTEQNLKYHGQVKELERKIMQSFKAIQEFKNDALKAREQIIVKDQEFQNYKNNQPILEIKTQKSLIAVVQSAKDKNSLNLNTLSKKQIQVYTSLLQNSIQQRKNIFEYIKTIMKSQAQIDAKQNDRDDNKAKLNQLKNEINKLFIQVLKGQKRSQNIRILQSKKIVSTILSSMSS